MDAAARRDRLWWVAVGAIALAGLAVRIVAARGGLWTDEAWSVIYAAQAKDAAGVFLRINHDNNHHLYSLWLQTIGPAASPLLARAPAIIAGALSIPAAALLAGRRSRVAGFIAALLFALTPVFVAFGSEARGYSLMLLAALVMLIAVSDVLDGRGWRAAPLWIAGLALFGMLSHMTMAAPVAIATAWFYLERRSAAGPTRAIRDSIVVMGPAIGVTAGVVAFVFIAAALSPTGMRLGGYTPFAARDYTVALDDLALWSAGLAAPLRAAVPLLLGGLAIEIAIRPPEWLGARARLYALMILAVPVGVLVLRSGNPGFARYYLVSAVGLLLLIAEWIGHGLAARPLPRAAASLLLATMITAGATRDWQLVAAARGDPGRPVADMAELAPAGTRVALGERRFQSVVALAALRRDYTVEFAGGCAPADFLLAAQSRWAATRSTVDRCGVRMDVVDSSVVTPLTGDSWVLYRARSLQRLKAADSGRAPAAMNRRLSGRAGVAQG